MILSGGLADFDRMEEICCVLATALTSAENDLSDALEVIDRNVDQRPQAAVPESSSLGAERPQQTTYAGQ